MAEKPARSYGSEDFLTELGERIRLARGRRSKSDLAAALGIHANTLANYEDGKRSPEALVLARIADELCVSVDYLMTGRQEMRPDGIEEGLGYYQRLDNIRDASTRVRESLSRTGVDLPGPVAALFVDFTYRYGLSDVDLDQLVREFSRYHPDE